MKKILTVVDRFDIRERGLIVVPGPLLADFKSPCAISVELRRPDGSTTIATLHLEVEFQTPPPVERRYAAVLRGLRSEDVPVETEIWGFVDDARTT